MNQTAGYSSRSLAQKLGIRPGARLALIGAPDAWSIEGLPEGVAQVRNPAGPFDIAVWFLRSRADLTSQIAAVSGRVPPKSSLWVAWPRRAGGHTSDVTEQGIRDVVLPLGLVDVKVAALDNDWSGLKLVWRISKRSALGSR